MKNIILLKFLNEEIWIYKNNEFIIEKTNKIISNNFIIDSKELQNSLEKIQKKHNISNTLLQKKIYIFINKLYCVTNKYIIKNIMYNLGITNYKLIYEEDLYKKYNMKILSYWNNNGIYLNDNNELYVDCSTNLDKLIENNTMIITANKDILNNINKKYTIYEDIKCPIFHIFINNKEKNIN